MEIRSGTRHIGRPGDLLRGHGRPRRPARAADHGAGRAAAAVARRASARSWSARAYGSSVTTTAMSVCPARPSTGSSGQPLVPRMVRSWLGLPSKAAYTLEDMADDAAALLDHLDIERAHIVGASMGGMIAQVFAARFAERTKTLGVIFSSNNSPFLPPPAPRALLALLKGPPPDSPREVIIDNAVRVSRYHRQPALPARPKSSSAPTRPRATTVATTRRASPGTSARSWAAAAWCTTTGGSSHLPS